MTMRQEAVEKINCLPDDSVRIVLAFIDEQILGNRRRTEDDDQKKMKALHSIMEMWEKSPYPQDFDYDKAREEAMAEKYGYFN